MQLTIQIISYCRLNARADRIFRGALGSKAANAYRNLQRQRQSLQRRLSALDTAPLLEGTSKNTISPCVEAAIAYNLDS